ncbi:hypothetical protein V5O48_018952, partial [Marasmius crinis-equi]
RPFPGNERPSLSDEPPKLDSLPMSSTSIKDAYGSEGFVIVFDLVSRIDFEALRAACKTVITKTREGEWPIVV